MAIVPAPIVARGSVPECGPSDAAYTDAADVVACMNYLNKLGQKQCDAGSGYKSSTMRSAGNAHITGYSSSGNPSSSYL
jgi:hypothetical protein